MDVHQTGYRLKYFLIDYKHFLLEEHLTELQNAFEYLKIFKDSTLILIDNSEYHWSICPYVNEENITLPDTCFCVTAEKTMKRVDDLINFYFRLRPPSL